jgi:hypothetical protein
MAPKPIEVTVPGIVRERSEEYANASREMFSTENPSATDDRFGQHEKA